MGRRERSSLHRPPYLVPPTRRPPVPRLTRPRPPARPPIHPRARSGRHRSRTLLLVYLRHLDGRSGRGTQEADDAVTDPGMDLLYRLGGIQYQVPLGIRRRAPTVGTTDQTVEVEASSLQAVRPGGRAGTSQSSSSVNVQEDHQIRLEPSGGPPVQVGDPLLAESASGTLVDDGGVGIAVAQHDGASL